MPTKKTSLKSKAPTASRPLLPQAYGVPKDLKGSVSWAWAKKRLSDSHNYLITTVRPDCRPHTMIVWGIWLDGAYYFSTGSSTRKAQNLAVNPNCIVCNENVEEAVIVEGKAERLKIADIPAPAFRYYFEKYGWKLDPEMGDVYKVTPSKIIAIPEKLFPKGATRWMFA
jgi:hypothetical protein